MSKITKEMLMIKLEEIQTELNQIKIESALKSNILNKILEGYSIDKQGERK